MTFAIELCRQQFFRQRHTNGSGNTLTEWARRGLDTDGRIVLGMAGRARAQLPEIFDVLDRERMARQVQHRIEQHRCVPVGEHEAITIDPARVRRVVVHDLTPKHLGDVRHAHGSTRVPRGRLLHRIHGERPNGVGESAAISHGEGSSCLRETAILAHRAPFFQ